jgi:hypothetical protein
LPYVLFTMARRPVETPQEHVRVALQLLDELEGELGVLSVGMPAGYGPGGLLAATRRRLCFALAALESPPGPVRPWVRRGRVARGRAWPLMIGFAVLAWAASALAFVLRGVWHFTRAVVRLIYMLRVLGP